MRILFLSNFYPPIRAGGYAQLCQEVAQGLEQRGHTIGVLASNYEKEKVPANEPNIYRLLHLESKDLNYYQPFDFFKDWQRRYQENLETLTKVIETFKPDIFFVWGMWALSKSLPALAETLLPSRTAYYLADYWPAAEDMHTTYWRRLSAQRWYMKLPKRLLSYIAQAMLTRNPQPSLRLEQVFCVSATLREILIKKGVPLQHAKVIYNGIEIDQFLNHDKQPFFERDDRTVKLLYAGQLVRHKGVHTAVEAMAKLVNRYGLDQINLTILGGGHPDYETLLRTIVEQENLDNHVFFQTPVPREQMPSILQQCDALIFPSIYNEPLARMTQEAMASGLIVVGTTTGGTKEILADGQNGLTFAPEDSEELAQQIMKFATDPDLYQRLVTAARQTVVEKFTIDRTVSQIEDYLKDMLENGLLLQPEI